MKSFLIALAIIVLAGLAIWFFRPSSTSPSSDPALQATSESSLKAVLRDVQGTVTIKRDGQESAATSSQEVVTGDVIKTGSDGQASIEFFAGSRVGLNAYTELTITEAYLNPKNLKQQRIHLTLEIGHVWSRVLQLLDSGSSYDIQYNDVRSSVRGTAFLIRGTRSDNLHLFQLDEFDGTVAVSGLVNGNIESGFSANFYTEQPPQDLKRALLPTSDEVRDDYFVRRQLRADEDFAKRANEERRRLGLPTQDIHTIGHEAGAFVLDQPGMMHSGYRMIEIVPDDRQTTLTLGQPIFVRGYAIFEDERGHRSQDVTTLASWQAYNPDQGFVDEPMFQLSDNRLRLTPTATGTLTIIARWNDGTHEHSGTMTFTVGEQASSTPIGNIPSLLNIPMLQ